jgi:branched-chain amino acid transport system ATP-binding protein
VRRGLCLVPQGRRIFAPLTVRENLLLGARRAEAAGRPVSAPRWDLERVFALFPRLAERSEQAGGTLSGGEQQMLAIGRALLTNGRLLLLDEPSEGLAPIVVREVGQTLQLLKRQQMSILLVEQNYHLALGVADRVYVMNKGQIVWEGTPVALEGAEDVKRRYLGVA